MLSGNKGEWSEIYTLLKLLGDSLIYSGDSALNKIESIIYPIVKIIRENNNETNEYVINDETITIILSGSNKKLNINKSKFLNESYNLLNKINSSSGTFNYPELEIFLHSIGCHTLKASSKSKSDITIVIYDEKLNHEIKLGFSIKSKLGNNSTLLNAGKTTNFIYEIKNIQLSDDQIRNINEIDTRSKIKDRINKIQDLGGRLNFSSLENEVFYNNLVLIDSLLPHIVSELVKIFYISNLNTVKDIIDEIIKTNPLNYNLSFSHNFYNYKIKKLLTDIALGMTPAGVWNGLYDATGGYLIVKEDGDVLCYHIYNRNIFEDYLFDNPKLETASSTRHDFGSIYKENNKLFIKLNLQIRFI